MEQQDRHVEPRLRAPQSPALRWGLAVLLAALAGVGLSYFWRVFFSLDSRFSPLAVTLAGAAAGAAAVGAAALLRCVRDRNARAALCILLCGLLFVFADPPLQPPDESTHYLRTYAISMGRLDFDAARGYPADVSALVGAFPGAWVNAHTSVGLGTDPISGHERGYDSAGYALKQYGSHGAIQSIADSFQQYFSQAQSGAAAPVTEPLSFLVLPFLPGALGMALARLPGLGALGCLYAGRAANLLAYTALCWLALRRAERGRALLLAFMLLPLSLYMGASLSYDATLLGGYYLMLALLTRRRWDAGTAAWYTAACVLVNLAKPYLNLLWALLPLLVCRADWGAGGCLRAGRLAVRRRHVVMAALALSLAATLLVEWYGAAFRLHYPAVIPRAGGESVDGVGQLRFILAHPARYIAVMLGTLYENDGFLGRLGLFGALDLPVPLLNLTGPLMLALGALFSAGTSQGLGRRRTLGLAGFAAVYAVGAMTAMYITYTPVGMVRIVGLQARYFLPVFLALGFGAAAVWRRALRLPPSWQKPAVPALPVFGGYAALGALLLFQHYFVGPYYTVPV